MFYSVILKSALIKLITSTTVETTAVPAAGKLVHKDDPDFEISEGPKLFLGNNETDESKKTKSINGGVVPDKQQWIQFVVDLKTQEAATKYSQKMASFDGSTFSSLQLLKYKTTEKKEDGKLKDTPIDDKFSFTKDNTEIDKLDPVGKDFKYVVSVCSETGKANNLYEKLTDEKNKEAAWVFKLKLDDGSNQDNIKYLETFPFRIDTSKAPHILVNALNGSSEVNSNSKPWYKNWKYLLGIGISILIIGLLVYLFAMKQSSDSDNYE